MVVSSARCRRSKIMVSSIRLRNSGRKCPRKASITFASRCGKFDLDVTTHQMAVLFCWENRRHERLSLENLRLATELPETELRRTLWGLVAMPKIKRQVLLYEPAVSKPSDFSQVRSCLISNEIFRSNILNLK